MVKLVPSRNYADSQPAFSACRTEFTEKPSAPFKKAENPGLETSLRFHIYLYLYMISASKRHGKAYKQVRICACRRFKQSVTYLLCKYPWMEVLYNAYLYSFPIFLAHLSELNFLRSEEQSSI